MIEITTEVGRLVSGHPMVGNIQKDDNNDNRCYSDGTAMLKFYAGVAFAKKGETSWKDTPWGQQIVQEAMKSYPNNEHNSPNFAWKIEDGDSTIPNEKGKIPNQREGWAGHWIIHASNLSPMSCYHDGKPITPFNSIKDKNEIKCGDYIQLILQVKDNKGAKTRKLGMYVNLVAVLVKRAGQRIVGVNEPDSAALFGASNAEMPANALIDIGVTAPAPQPGVTAPAPQPGVTAPAPQPGVTAPAPQPGVTAPAPQPGVTAPAPQPGVTAPAPQPGVTAPAPDFLKPDFNVNVNGQIYLASALKALNWTDDQIAALPRI